MTSCPSIDGTTPTRIVLGNVRRHPESTQVFNEIRAVVPLVSPERDSLRAVEIFDHHQGRVPLRRAGRQCQTAVDHQFMTILHQRVPHVAQDRSGISALAAKPRIRISRRPMRLVAALPPSEVNRRITTASVAARRILVIDRPETLVGGPRLNERTVDGEVLVAEQAGFTRPADDGIEEALSDLAVEETVTFTVPTLGESPQAGRRALPEQGRTHFLSRGCRLRDAERLRLS